MREGWFGYIPMGHKPEGWEGLLAIVSLGGENGVGPFEIVRI
jgi:hypothetical protein